MKESEELERQQLERLRKQREEHAQKEGSIKEEYERIMENMRDEY